MLNLRNGLLKQGFSDAFCEKKCAPRGAQKSVAPLVATQLHFTRRTGKVGKRFLSKSISRERKTM